MNCKKNAKSRSDDEHRLFDPAVEKVVELGLERLRPFENHPFKVKEDDSIISMVDSNLHREKILFSEKAFAYSMKNEAMKCHCGTSGAVEPGKGAGLIWNLIITMDLRRISLVLSEYQECC